MVETPKRIDIDDLLERIDQFANYSHDGSQKFDVLMMALSLLEDSVAGLKQLQMADMFWDAQFPEESFESDRDELVALIADGFAGGELQVVSLNRARSLPDGHYVVRCDDGWKVLSEHASRELAESECDRMKAGIAATAPEG